MNSPLSNSTAAPRPRRSRQAVTLYDVAAHAGVKPMTVSRALNGGNVSAGLRETVLKSVQELGYQPNQAARSIKSGKSRQIGVLVRNNSRASDEERKAHPLAYQTILGVSEGLEEAGYMMNFVRLSDVDPVKHTQSSAFQGHLLDGLLVVGDVPAANAWHLQELVPHCVWVDGNVWHEQGCLRRDERFAGETAAREVANLGYRKWVLLSPLVSPNVTPHFSEAERLAGINAVAQEIGADVSAPVQMPYGSGDFSQLWPLLRPDVAVIVTSIYLAERLFCALRGTALRAGFDFALACCDDGQPNSIEDLSRVSFDRFEMGQRAARLIISRLDDSEFSQPSQLLRGAWQPRRTTPPCPNSL